MKRLILFLCLITTLSYSQTVTDEINRIAKESAKNGTLAVSVIDNTAKKELLASNSEKWMVPASTLKLLTTGAAISVLGKDFRFKMELLCDGPIQNGNLNGNLYIKGYGDPTFCSHRYNNEEQIWANFTKAVQEAGITSVSGKIIADISAFENDDTPGKWIYMDAGNYFGAEANAINYRENFFKIYFKRSQKPGDSTQIIRTEPVIKDWNVKNYVTVGPENSGDQAYVYGHAGSKNQYIKGTIPPGDEVFSIKAAMPLPEKRVEEVFQKYLEKNNISVGGKINSKAEKRLLYTHSSENIIEISQKTNLHSINLYADAILKQMGYTKKGKGSIKNGIEAVKEYWKNTGIDTKELLMEDGCGLSPLNLVKSSVICKAVSITPNIKNIMAVSGESGTLKNFGKGTVLEGKFWGKSGNMDRVMSYAGILKTKTGKEISVCIIANNYQTDDYKMKKEMEKLLILMYENY